MGTPSYCSLCGRPLQGGRCPIHGGTPQEGQQPETPPRKQPLWQIALLAAGVTLVLLSIGIAAFAQLHADLDRAAKRMDALTRQNRAQQVALAELERTLQVQQSAEPNAAPDTPHVAVQVRASVYTVETGQVLGSTWVVKSEGGISTFITNYHVIADVWRVGARSVDIVKGLQTFHGTIERVSIAEDLAAIRVNAIFEPLSLATEPAKVGEAVIVVGSPFGLQGSVSTGIVSAVRSRFIQFSAPVSPGDSGAPVVNERGEVLGVVASKIEGGGAEGLSFAIPISTVCRTVAMC